MSAPAPFITSYQLADFSPADIPFMVDAVTPADARHTHLKATHRHSYFMLAICIEGESSHMVDFMQIDLKAGEMMLIIPGQVHQPLEYNSNKGYITAFNADFLVDHHATLPIHPSGPVKLSDKDFLQADIIMTQLLMEYKQQAPQYVAMLQHYLALLLTLFFRHAPTHNESGHPLLSKYRALLAAHFLEWTKPSQYAKAMHVSVDHLNEVIKQHTGQTVSAHINERRLLEAKRLLLHAKESIKEIAWSLQFNELSYFNRFFKQHTGITPAVFREKSREKYVSAPE
ncbi:helix-turn-helix transcriptional regulator [Chitinophaga rhizophila]|uniref:AraC family transcriptional regulator n=1 Tax=Chitinophaga rhizophila TaxID=2866212 RepID=A0ABS7G9S1_9BACT|nr:helix-turn-helix domain-containing protein [Chitinophaga rhizophila]MBW8684408.1 AraC family transcriptional regulator [Chitinophaga rhizophila]